MTDVAEPTPDRIAQKYAVALAIIDHLLAIHESLLDAVRAGGRYSDALLRYQEHGVRGQMIPPTDELEQLFKAWHDQGHAAIALAEGRDG